MLREVRQAFEPGGEYPRVIEEKYANADRTPPLLFWKTQQVGYRGEYEESTGGGGVPSTSRVSPPGEYRLPGE